MWTALLLLLATDPTFLRRYLPEVQPQASDYTTQTCRYKPLFGAGDPQARLLRGISRYGELEVEGECAPVSFAGQEHAYVVLEGSGTLLYGEEKAPLRKHDFFYVPPGARHAILGGPLRLVVMGFRTSAAAAGKLQLANMDDVPLQTVGGHPPSTQYRLLMGGLESKRDRIAAGRVLTSLFVMEFAPGGTNIPHHHEMEEEIYLVLEGRGDMVAGSGPDGVEGRYPTRPGDVFFFRLNATVGFYNTGEKARILAVRSRFPFPR